MCLDFIPPLPLNDQTPPPPSPSSHPRRLPSSSSSSSPIQADRPIDSSFVDRVRSAEVLCICVYVYVYIYICVCVCVCVYTMRRVPRAHSRQLFVPCQTKTLLSSNRPLMVHHLSGKTSGRRYLALLFATEEIVCGGGGVRAMRRRDELMNWPVENNHLKLV